MSRTHDYFASTESISTRFVLRFITPDRPFLALPGNAALASCEALCHLAQSLDERQAVVCIDALSLWERGLSAPQEHYRRKICEFYGKRPPDLDLGEDFQITEGQIAMLQNILGSLNLDRRQALELVKQVPALGVLVELLAEPSSGIPKPAQFLSQSTAVIKVCWQQMESGGYAMVESLLGEYETTLHALAIESEEHQEEASSLRTVPQGFSNVQLQFVHFTILATSRLPYPFI